MRTIITSKNFNASDHLKETIEKKLEKLGKYFSDDIEAHVKITQIKEKQKLEATISAKGTIFRAEETADVAYDSIEKVVDKLSSQMSRFKSKLQKKHKDHKDFMFAEVPDFDQDEAVEIVKKKSVTLSPMSVDEAIMQMELLGHSFFIFIDADTDAISVIYSREHGNYGVIEAAR